MGSTIITIRGLDEEVKRKLRVRAATNNRSLEAELRSVLTKIADGSFIDSGVEQTLAEALAAAPGTEDIELPKVKINSFTRAMVFD